MSVTKRNTSHKRVKKNPPTIVVVTKTYHPAEEAIFPDKIKKVKEVLTKANFAPPESLSLMPIVRKNRRNSKSCKKRLPPVVVVINTFISAEENPFPEKLKKAQEILSRTKFLDR
jgi:hypothetical protein